MLGCSRQHVLYGARRVSSAGGGASPSTEDEHSSMLLYDIVLIGLTGAKKMLDTTFY